MTQEHSTARGPRPAGRPRDLERHRAVLTSTRAILVADGYPGVTFAEVARSAGVTRQLVYRWWPTKAALVSEAMFAAEATTWPSTFPGPLDHDVRTWVDAMVTHAARPDVRAGVRGLLAEIGTSDTLPGLSKHLITPIRHSLDALLTAAQARGEVHPDIDPVLTTETVTGAITMHLLLDRAEPPVITAHLTQLLTWAFGSRAAQQELPRPSAQGHP
ncbi:TetR/AcrR family transcriptional regulator [Uniformispora flossi]|uniref:TetR/AcrR family transcriptional regulator n=1 Tax=Uniformispora flossi TaxID=3390723 RepID=UPI003C2BECFC